MSFEELKKKATELKVEFKDDVTEDDLNVLVTKKEEELSSDLDYLRERVKFLDEESKKAFSKRDSATADKRALSTKIKELEDKLKDSINKEELTKLQKEFEDLKKYKEDIEKQREAEELAKTNEVERAKIQFNKEMDKMRKEFDDMKTSFDSEREKSKNITVEQSKLIESLRGNKLESEILRFAAKYNAYNPDQIVALTKVFFTYDEQLNKYSHLVRDDKGKITDELSVEDYIKTYLGKDENENLVKSGAADTGFDTKTQSRADTKTTTTQKGKYNPKDPAIIKEATDKNLPPEDWAIIKEKMEIKQSKMKEKK